MMAFGMGLMVIMLLALIRGDLIRKLAASLPKMLLIALLSYSAGSSRECE